MRAVRCAICGLLVGPSVDGYGRMRMASAGNHEPTKDEYGFAVPSETPACDGSEMLGYVIDVSDRSLDHVIYDGYGYFDKQGHRIGSTRP